MIHRTALVVALVAAGVLAPGGTALSQQAPPDPAPDLATSLMELNHSMKEIASLLQQQLDNQKADLLMKRMDISARALATQEQLLRAAVSERDSLSDQMTELRARADQMRAELDKETPVGSHSRKEELDRLESELELRQGLIKERLATADQKVMQLENDVSRFRDEIRAWQELVDARLGLR